MVGFKTGWSGSPFHLEYYANEGMKTGEGGKPADRAISVGPGALGKKVTMDYSKNNGGKNGKKK